MAKTMVLGANGEIHTTTSEKPLTNAERAAERRMLDCMADVVLYDVIPSHVAEYAPGQWGYGRSGEREAARFLEMAEQTKRAA